MFLRLHKPGLSGMLPYSTRDIFPLRYIKFMTNALCTVHPSDQSIR